MPPATAWSPTYSDNNVNLTDIVNQLEAFKLTAGKCYT